MTHLEPVRVLQIYSPQKNAEFAAMGPAQRLAWLDEVRALYFHAAAVQTAPPPPTGN